MPLKFGWKNLTDSEEAFIQKNIEMPYVKLERAFLETFGRIPSRGTLVKRKREYKEKNQENSAIANRIESKAQEQIPKILEEVTNQIINKFNNIEIKHKLKNKFSEADIDNLVIQQIGTVMEKAIHIMNNTSYELRDIAAMQIAAVKLGEVWSKYREAQQGSSPLSVTEIIESDV